jgi:hypothetical protein
VSLRALVSLFRAAMYMEPLHPEGEAVAIILPRLRNCLLSDDIPLAMYAVRLINHLTDMSEDAACRRGLLVGGAPADGEAMEAVDQFLCAVTMLLNDTDDETHLAHLTGAPSRALSRGGHQLHRTVSDTNSEWRHVRSFSTHGHQSAAKGSSSAVSRSDIRSISSLLFGSVV